MWTSALPVRNGAARQAWLIAGSADILSALGSSAAWTRRRNSNALHFMSKLQGRLWTSALPVNGASFHVGAPIFYRYSMDTPPQFQCASFHVEADVDIGAPSNEAPSKELRAVPKPQGRSPGADVDIGAPSTEALPAMRLSARANTRASFLTLSAPGTFPASRPRCSPPWVF